MKSYKPERKYKYRLIVGSHCESDIEVDEETKNEHPRLYQYNEGDCFLSAHSNLVERFGADKFERLPDNYDLDTHRAAQSGAGVPQTMPKDFSDLSDKELRSVAAEQEVDISKCKNREDIVRVLTAAMKAVR